MKKLFALVIAVSALFIYSCGDDDEGKNDADKIGVGAQCLAVDDCEDGQECLTDFKGGYCGLKDCTKDSECPEGSVCVAHDDGVNYCFLICAEKTDCNTNRDEENLSNCVSSVTYVEEQAESIKACVPPSN